MSLLDTKTVQKRWLDAQMEGTTPLVNVLPACLALCDLKNDGYFKLIAAEMSNHFEGKAKLKVFKGITLMSERGLPGFASGVSILYIDEHEPKIPIIAVALGSSVLLYRNLKPYFKYTLPSMDVEPLEQDIWKQFQTAAPESIPGLCRTLASMDTSQMTTLSQKLLSLPESLRHDFVKANLNAKLERLSIITAMTTMPKNSTEPKATMCLAVAAESGDIYILDSTAFTVLQQAKVCAFQLTPVIVSASGLFDVDYNMVISTREGPICILRKGWLEGQQIIRLDHPATGLALLPIEQTIIVVCMDKSLMCYSKRGKKIWFVGLMEKAICMTHIILPHLGITLVAVALAGGRVQIYLQKKLVDEFDVEETVSSMIFGRLGQEEHVLVLVTITGVLQIKILKRTAQFSSDSAYDEAIANQSAAAINNLQIPKKSKIFLEQTIRERDNAPAIHQSFQAELWRLRLHAARETIDIINSAEGTFSGDVGQVPLKLAAEILGTGPLYKMYLQVENMSTSKEASGLYLILHADHRHYNLDKCFTHLPMIIPGSPVKLDFDVSLVMDPRDGLPPSDLTQENSVIKVLIVKQGQAKPLIASTVVMPLVAF